MAIEHIWEERGLYTRYTGEVTGPELISSALELSGDSRFDELRYVIGDWSEATGSAINADDVKALVAMISALARTNPSVRNASVMATNDRSQSLVALYGLLTEGLPWQVEGFYCSKEARRWATQAND